MAKVKKLKVLILSHSSELGGAERSMIDLFDYWTERGLVEPYFIIRMPLSNMVPELKKRKWQYKALYYTNWSQRNPSKVSEDIFTKAQDNAKAVSQIERVIEKFKPDVVMTNTIVAPWAALAAYYQGVPHVWFVREYGDIDHQHVFELGRSNMYEDIDTLSDLVVTNSETLARHIAKNINNQKIQPLYTPFDLDLLRERINERVSSPFQYKDSLKLVITGRIAPSKGQEEAAAAVGELIKRGYNAELCVIGAPAEEKDATALGEVITKYGIANKVHIVGQKTNPLAIIKHADVGIMASQQEAFGRVTFEYMAAGLPVVGANSGATPELVKDGKTGFLYTKNNKDDLTSKLERYAENRALISKHGDEAKKCAEEMMDGEYNADNLYKTIKTTLSKRQAQPIPLHFSRRWLQYPVIAQQYIDDAHLLSLPQILKRKVRAKLKHIYLIMAGYLDKRKKDAN